MASQWSDFSRETLGDPYLVWHDGADYALLLRRWRAEPDLTERMLRAGLAQADAIAAGGVAYLAHRGADVAGFGGLLREVLPGAKGTFRIRVAQALLKLTGDQDYAGAVCDVLTGDDFWGVKIDAAMALSGFARSPVVIDALASGVKDEQYLVRRHSAQSLLTLAGRKTAIEKVPRWWEKIRGDDPQTWRAAAAELARLAAVA